MNFYVQTKGLLCLSYDDYGCWCGPGGSGTPVDESDKCCRSHDFCYDAILAKGSCNPYLVQYKYLNGTCVKSVDKCKHRTCNCDRKLALCLSKAEHHWRYWGYRFWPGSCKV
nr:basic phospholipase A2 BFPA-like [Hydra vulgaris]